MISIFGYTVISTELFDNYVTDALKYRELRADAIFPTKKKLDDIAEKIQYLLDTISKTSVDNEEPENMSIQDKLYDRNTYFALANLLESLAQTEVKRLQNLRDIAPSDKEKYSYSLLIGYLTEIESTITSAFIEWSASNL